MASYDLLAARVRELTESRFKEFEQQLRRGKAESERNAAFQKKRLKRRREFMASIGMDMERFPTVKHFCSWLGLAPHNDISGGKVLRSRTMKVRNRANQAFRQAAQSVAQSDSCFGAYYRAMRARLGPKQAIVATAHKIARAVYQLLKTREPYREESATEYDRKRRERVCLNESTKQSLLRLYSPKGWWAR